MSTSKCEKSEHRKEIDEAAKNGMSARKISDMLLVKFNEHMSHTAIHNYLDKSKSLDEESAIEAVENLEKRVRNLELNAFAYGPGGSDNGWKTYSLAGVQLHALRRIDVLLDAIPKNTELKAEFKELEKRCIAKQQKEDGLPLDEAEFIKQRAENAKNEKEALKAEIEAKEESMEQQAKDELLRIKTDRENTLKVLEKAAKEHERQKRLQDLRDAKLEKDAGIDSEGNPIVES
jgi:hypothetical protein